MTRINSKKLLVGIIEPFMEKNTEASRYSKQGLIVQNKTNQKNTMQN